MIKNVVFDMVGVLMRFDTEGYYRTHDICAEEQEILRREVFRSLEWAMQDRGSLSDEETAAAICPRLPVRLRPAAQDFIFRENRRILPVPGMEALLCELKGAGVRLYLLSNTSAAFHRFRSRIPGIALFDGEMVSAAEGLGKRNPQQDCQFDRKVKPGESCPKRQVWFSTTAPPRAERHHCVKSASGSAAAPAASLHPILHQILNTCQHFPTRNKF